MNLHALLLYSNSLISYSYHLEWLRCLHVFCVRCVMIVLTREEIHLRGVGD